MECDPYRPRRPPFRLGHFSHGPTARVPRGNHAAMNRRELAEAIPHRVQAILDLFDAIGQGARQFAKQGLVDLHSPVAPLLLQVSEDL